MAVVHHIYHGRDCHCSKCAVAKGFERDLDIDEDEISRIARESYEVRCRIARETDSRGNWCPSSSPSKKWWHLW